MSSILVLSLLLPSAAAFYPLGASTDRTRAFVNARAKPILTTTAAADEAIRVETPKAAEAIRVEWDMSSFPRRFSAYAQIVSPSTLLKSEAEIEAAAVAVSARREALAADATIKAAAKRPFWETPYWERSVISVRPEKLTEMRGVVVPTNRFTAGSSAALALRDSAVHPETGKLMLKPFRRAFFAPFNVPMYFAMLAAPNTHFWNIFWQVFNQAYNSGMNYVNRSGSTPGAAKKVALNFLAATTTAVFAATLCKIYLGRLMAGAIAGGGVAAALARSLVPWCATTAASVVNLLLTRRDEWAGRGVALRTEARGDIAPVAYSLKAGRAGLRATGLSRAVLPTCGLILPPLLVEGILRLAPAGLRTALRLPAFALAMVCSTMLALPLSLAPWPWFIPFNVAELEPEVQEAAATKAGGAEVLYFNKGL